MWLSCSLWYNSSQKHSNSLQSTRLSQINQSHRETVKKNSPGYQKSINWISESKLKSSCLLCVNNHKKRGKSIRVSSSTVTQNYQIIAFDGGKIPKFNYDSGRAHDEAIIESIYFVNLNWNWYFAAFCLELKFHRALHVESLRQRVRA